MLQPVRPRQPDIPRLHIRQRVRDALFRLAQPRQDRLPDIAAVILPLRVQRVC